MRGTLRLVLGVAVCLPVVTVALALPAGATTHRAPAGVVIKVKSPSKYSVSSNFVGLTFEGTTFGKPYLDPSQSNLPSFLAELGNGNLRFGGQTSDLDAPWQPDPTAPLPPWATTGITPGDLAAVGNLAHQSGWSVDLGVNLLHYDPAAAAGEVQAAQAAIGSSLRRVEIGNEPDLYFYFKTFLTIPVVGVPTTFPAYQINWNAYVTAIKAADPGVNIAGPDFFTNLWLPSITGRTEKGISAFTYHYYPYVDCSGTPVSAAQLLDPSTFTSESSTMAAALKAAKKTHSPLVIDEMNSIACQSSSPAVHQFSASLWAVHALLEAASSGVTSVNMQMNPANCNSYTPLCVPDPSAPATLQATPVFYGMQLVSSLEGGTILKSKVAPSDPLPSGVSEYAVQLPNGNVAVVVDNTTTTDLTQLSVQQATAGQLVSTQSLTAPSADASTGVVLSDPVAASGPPTGLTVPADSVEVFTLAP